jgi:hypothetical protein
VRDCYGPDGTVPDMRIMVKDRVAVVMRAEVRMCSPGTASSVAQRMSTDVHDAHVEGAQGSTEDCGKRMATSSRTLLASQRICACHCMLRRGAEHSVLVYTSAPCNCQGTTWSENRSGREGSALFIRSQGELIGAELKCVFTEKVLFVGPEAIESLLRVVVRSVVSRSKEKHGCR